MTQKTKKLYFTNDFSPENVEKLQGEGWTLRNRAATHKGDFIEDADEYGGGVPDWYQEKGEQITVTLNTEIAPELQQAIDDAKAECEKVVAENAELKEQLDKERAAVKKLTSENAELLNKVLAAEKTLVEADVEIKSLKAASKKPTAAELKAAKAAEEAVKAEQPKE